MGMGCKHRLSHLAIVILVLASGHWVAHADLCVQKVTYREIGELSRKIDYLRLAGLDRFQLGVVESLYRDIQFLKNDRIPLIKKIWHISTDTFFDDLRSADPIVRARGRFYMTEEEGLTYHAIAELVRDIRQLRERVAGQLTLIAQPMSRANPEYAMLQQEISLQSRSAARLVRVEESFREKSRDTLAKAEKYKREMRFYEVPLDRVPSIEDALRDAERAITHIERGNENPTSISPGAGSLPSADKRK